MMNKEKIAVLIDSGTDIPDTYLERENIFVLPLRIIFDEKEYIDKVDINSMEVFEKMQFKIPSTSLPTGEDILNSMNEIRSKGYEKIIAITIASGLSGTNAAVNNIVNEYGEDLEIVVINTKNISVGAGMFAINAIDAIEEGKTFDEIIQLINSRMTKTHVFFTVGTLEYLKKGGRISSFAATVSDLLNIKPIITCDVESDGSYSLIAKERGKKRSHERLIKLAKDIVEKTSEKKYLLSLVYGATLQDFEVFKAKALEALPDFENLYIVQVSPALGVHTGPDAMGICVQLFD